MMTFVGFALVALVGLVFVLLAITPMMAEGRSDGPVRCADVVPIRSVDARADTEKRMHAA